MFYGEPSLTQEELAYLGGMRSKLSIDFQGKFHGILDLRDATSRQKRSKSIIAIKVNHHAIMAPHAIHGTSMVWFGKPTHILPTFCNVGWGTPTWLT